MGKGHTTTTTQRCFTLVALFLLALLLAPGEGWGQAQPSPYTTPNIYLYTVPAGVTSITVQCWGAGGGGGNTTGATSAGGGGGGAYTKGTFTVTPSSTVSITVGAGGAPGIAGGSTTVTCNGVTLTANGGSAASDQDGGAGGLSFTNPGVASFASYAGGTGGNGGNNYTGVFTTWYGGGGGGGGSATNTADGTDGSSDTAAGWGANGTGGAGGTGTGNGGAGSNGSGNKVAASGTQPGGGGGGRGGKAKNSGSGAAGEVIITIDPVLNLSEAAFDFGFTVNGSISSAKSFTLSGAYLSSASGNITVTPTANFEVSKNGTTWSGTSVSVSYTGSALSATPIYVRFKPTSANTDYSGNVVVSGGGTIAQNVAVTGTSISVSPIYYSFKTGLWDDPTTWTSDPGGTTQVGTTIPDNNSKVVILTGRTVTLPADVATTGMGVTINDGAVLNLAAKRFTSTLASLSGQGTLRIGDSYFPAVTANGFVLVGGGTTEYNFATGRSLPTQAVYNNLTINTGGAVATQVADIALNGSLHVQSGTMTINDGTARRLKLTVAGDVVVDNGATLGVGTGKTVSVTDPTNTTNGGTAPFINYYDMQTHRVVVSGSFTNNGTIKLTNQAYPVYNAFPTDGAATLYFQGASNSSLVCNGVTNLYNLVVDKGIDQSFKLTVSSSDYKNFKLFGANNAAYDAMAPATAANPNIKKALWIRTGTLALKGLVVIPSLTEGTATNSEYYIPANGAMLLDGSDVVVLGTADDYAEVNAAYGVSGGTGLVNGLIRNGSNALVVLGKLQVNDGYLSTRESAGILYNGNASGQLIINGGTIDAKQLRDANSGNTGLFTYTQNGGSLLLRGRFQHKQLTSGVADLTNMQLNTTRASSGESGSVGTFHLNGNAANGFTMTNGTIAIYDACNTGTANAYQVGTSAANTNISGGTILLQPTAGTGTDATRWQVNSTASVGNITVNRGAGCTTIVDLNTNPLRVVKNVYLQSGDFDAKALDVSVGGNFTINSGTTYTNTGTSANRTIFNGAGKQFFTVNLAAALNLNRLKIDKAEGDVLQFEGTQGIINVADSLMLLNGMLDDNGRTINVSGGVYNSGKHFSTASTPGKIVLLGTAAQGIDGDGTGVFGNLDLNNATAAISLNANAIVEGKLTFLQDKNLNIGSNNLTIANTGSIVGANASRYIETSGQSGDGGLTITYPSAAAITFPIGAPSTRRSAAAYTPASIGFSTSPTTLGSVTVIPVGYEHPAITTNNMSLTYFWRVKSQGFSGIAPNSVTHSFTFLGTDMGGTKGTYLPALYDRQSYTWYKGGDSDISFGTSFTTNIINDWSDSKTFLDADYTAGNLTSFGEPTKYYSRQTGPWNRGDTWSTTGHTGAAASGYPAQDDIVVIGKGHTVTLDQNRSCASLQIEDGAVLDVKTFTGSNFSMVLTHPNGNGKIRVTTPVNSPSVFTFPKGDFSEFDVNEGTTEYYTIDGMAGTIYILPESKVTYGNLILSPKNYDNLALPNNTLTTIYGSLTCGGNTSDAWLATSWTGSMYAGSAGTVVEKTVRIKKDLKLNGGTLIYYNTVSPQHIIVDGDVVISPSAAIDVKDNNSNTLEIGGSLINNTNSDDSGYPYNSPNIVRFRDGANTCDVTFFGSKNATISNTSGTPTTIFNKVTVNKGNSQATTLTVNIGGTLSTPTDNWLTMQNGTLKYMRTNPNEDFTISQNTPFVVPATSGLYIDYSNSNGKTVYISNANTNSSDFFLNGKLTLVNGDVLVGKVNNASYNNDIEYSGGGQSEIDIQGGTLMVNGQIRRNPSNSAGILRYNQSGSSAVTIYGSNTNTTNAKLEVLNAGSLFKMSGSSTLNVVKGGGGSLYGDLYLRPEDAGSVVTGGTITFSPNGLSAQSYKLDASIPLYNLTITGGASKANVNLMVNKLELNGNLLLSDANSVLDARNGSNSMDVTLNGNFTNSGGVNSYIAGTNLTTFSVKAAAPYSGAQTLTGATNFYNLKVSPVTSLTLGASTPVTVSNDLTIVKQQLLYGTNAVNVKGNFVNNGSYDGSATTGGAILSGSVRQNVSGTGTFGRLELNNAAGAKALSEIKMEKNLKMTLGILDINQYLLTLGQSSIIEGSGFGTTKMITTDGVYSNVGIKKVFSSGANSFTYPIGVSGKYTPTALSISANNSVGFIRVNAINDRHPSTLSPYRVLHYYWEVESSGVSSLTGNMAFNYLDGDVKQAALDEASYIAARLVDPGNWMKVNTVTAASNKFVFNYTGVNTLTGNYTAGKTEDIPDNVPVYRSKADGNWNDAANWEPVGSFPACPAGGPNGCIVIVDHKVTANVDNCDAYKTTINGTLTVTPTTIGHNFGEVIGSGTLYLKNGNLPAGRFTKFFDCASNSMLVYGGSDDYTIIADRLDRIPNLIFEGDGSRMLPNKDITICKLLQINSATVTVNNISNRKITIEGKMERVAGKFLAGTGSTATVSFAGTTSQTVGNFTGTSAFNNFEINNSSGVTLDNAIEIKGDLLLTNGIITTGGKKFEITNISNSCVSPSSGSASSYVNGPMTKSIVQSESFQFPIGNATTLGNKLTLLNVETGTKSWTVEYVNPNDDRHSYSAPLSAVNTKEYWNVSVAGGGNAKVRVAWDSQSDLTPLMTFAGVADMRVAEYDGASSEWVEKNSTPAGTVNSGSATTDNRMVIPDKESRSYTLGCENTTKPRARLDVKSTDAICGDMGIPVVISSSFAIKPPYIITYTEGGVTKTATSNAMSFTIPSSVNGSTYQLTGFTYNNPPATGPVQTGVVDAAIVTSYKKPDVATATTVDGKTSVCGGTIIQLKGNESIVTGTGEWSIVDGNGGTLLDPTSYNSGFKGVNGNDYTVSWTITNGKCTSNADLTVHFTLLPDAPSAAAAQTLCSGSTVSNLAATASGAAVVRWYSVATAGTMLAETTLLTSGANYYAEAYSGEGCTSLTRTKVTVTVNTPPAVTIEQVSKPADASPYTVCAGGAINVQVKESGYSYSWSIDDATYNLTDADKQVFGVTAPDNNTLFLDIASGTLKTPKVSVTVKDSNGCINTANQTLNFYRIPVTGPPYHVGNNVAK